MKTKVLLKKSPKAKNVHKAKRGQKAMLVSSLTLASKNIYSSEVFGSEPEVYISRLLRQRMRFTRKCLPWGTTTTILRLP